MNIAELNQKLQENVNYKYWTSRSRHFNIVPIVNIYEEFKPFYNTSKYLISNFGRVYSLKHKIIMKPSLNQRGYCFITYFDDNNNRQDDLVHRIVMLTFCPIDNAENFQVNHLNGIKTWNIYCPGHPNHNLEWCTCQENVNHAVDHNLRLIAENSINAIFTNKQIDQICQILVQNPTISAPEIAQLMRVPYNYSFSSLIYNLTHNISWKSITQNYDFNRNMSPRTSIDEVHKICSLLEKGLNSHEIADELSKEYTMSFKSIISNIRTKRSWTDISSQYNF